MSDPRRFVLIEYVGGPWDGKVEIRDYPLWNDRVCIPLESAPVASAVVVEAIDAKPLFRVGEYRRDWSGRIEEMFYVHAITAAELMYTKRDPRELVAYQLGNKPRVIFKWDGE